MIRAHYDKIILGIALVALLVAFAFAALRPDVRPITDFVDIPRLHAGNTFEVSPPPQVAVATPEWTEPGAQPAGEEWIFDVFTPPVIFFNPSNQQFTVFARPEAPPPPFGVQLVAIRRQPYRIQLLGWLGRAGDYRINLENVETGEILLAREGREYRQMDAEVRSFRVERQQVDHGGGTSVFEDVGRVVIFDQRLQQEIELNSVQRRMDETPIAVFRPVLVQGGEITARTGETFTVGDFNFQVESIADPTARVSQINRADPQDRETQTLTVRPWVDRPVEVRAEGQQPPRQVSPAPQGGRPGPAPRQPASQDPTGADFAF
jgi:hypothetical protein